MNTLDKDIIPAQEEGATSETIASCECNDEKTASSFFTTVKNRLLNVNEWGSIAGLASADFRLCDEKGNEVNRKARPNDHFKIDVPGPGPATGDGYDWVRVETIDEKHTAESEMIAMVVRPATNPQNENKDVAHFFNDCATSSFIVERIGNTITAGVYGRNEKPNTDAEKVIDKARNSVMAAVAITGFSKLQWKGLVEGLVEKTD
jgi:hypothetical protein